MGTLNDAYRSVLSELPEAHRRAAEHLPSRLGLTRDPDGGWESFIELAPNRDLAAFAAEPLGLSGPVLERFRFAYCCGVYQGLLADRLADRQAAATPDLVALLPELRSLWRRALTDATGDERLAHGAISSAVDAFERGVALEREAFTARALTVAGYGKTVWLKSQWISAPAVCLLESRRVPARRPMLSPSLHARRFKLAYDLLILGLQCMDDALDCEEDEGIQGASIPSLLGFPPGGLFRTSAKITRLARRAAQAGGFARLDAWLEERAAKIEGLSLGGDRLRNELASVVIATCLEESCPWSDAELAGADDSVWLVPTGIRRACDEKRAYV